MTPLTTAGLLLVVSLLYTNSVPRITAVKFVCRGESLTLPCKTSDLHGKKVWEYSKSKYGKNKRSLVYFSKNKAYLSTSIPPMFKEITNISSDGTLIISKFNSELNGIYSCSREEKYYRLQTLVSVIAVPCKTKVCQGDNAIVECELLRHKDRLGSLQELVWKQGKTKIAVFKGPELNLIWHNPDYQSIKVSEKVKGALSIESASQDVDGSEFNCTLHVLGLTAKRCSFTVEVLTHCENKKDACEGERVDLKCPYYQLLTTSTEDTRLEWYNESRSMVTEDSGPMTDSSLVMINKSAGVVTLLSPSVSDSGVYSCKILREDVVLAEHSVTLNVTQCTETSPSHRKNQNKERPADDTDKKDPTIKISGLVLLVILILFILIGLPICLCRMVRNRQGNPDQQYNV